VVSLFGSTGDILGNLNTSGGRSGYAKINASLGKDLVPQESTTPFFEVKETSVVVVERNGVKTLRVVE
jgi:hypothetical protein